MKKTINEMTRKEFLALPSRKWNEEITFRSMIIIPKKLKHDSGYGCMDFVAVGKDEMPICLLSGCSDVIHFDGISGMIWDGKTFKMPEKTSNWSIDCLYKSQLLRVFSRAQMTCGNSLSSFEIYCKDL